MKKILALVLTAATAVSVTALGATAAAAANSTKEDVITDITLDVTNSDGDNQFVDLTTGGVTLNDGETYTQYVRLNATDVANKVPVLGGFAGKGDLRFAGTSTERATVSVKYETAAGSHSGIPRGVNGEELLRIRVSFDKDATDNKDGSTKNASYIVAMTAVKNPTVEVFSNTQVDLTVNTNVKSIINPTDANKGFLDSKHASYLGTTKLNQRLSFKIRLFGGGFTVQNARYSRKDVFKNTGDNYRIEANDERPVVDETAFDKAWGKNLTVDYPNYAVTFKNIKNQNVAINLEADVKKAGTVALDGKTPIMIASFHDIYVKDNVEIDFKISADAQNFKGQELFVYELNSDNKPTKEIKLKVRINDKNNIVMEVPAGSRLGSSGDVKTATYGIYSEAQSLTAGGSTGGSTGKNPGTGASDMINAATAFAAVSLAAAGFVAVKKSAK